MSHAHTRTATSEQAREGDSDLAAATETKRLLRTHVSQFLISSHVILGFSGSGSGSGSISGSESDEEDGLSGALHTLSLSS